MEFVALRQVVLIASAKSLRVIESSSFAFFLGIILFHSVFLSSAEIHEKVLICGVCRNVESRLEKTKIIMESIAALFDDYRIVIYENNSIDQTPAILQCWAKANPKVCVQSETVSQRELEDVIINVHTDGSLFVPEQIARARNIVLEKALSPNYEDFSYLIWLDMDFVKSPDLDGFIDTFHSPQEWDAVFAYGVDPKGTYWDWYAFRDANYPIGSELLGMDWWYMDKKLTLSQKDPWYPVYSAFGGCGIYKKSCIRECRYSALVTSDLEIHAKKLMEKRDHPQILKYLIFNKNLKAVYPIEKAKPNLPSIFNAKIGITLNRNTEALIWRMSSFVYQYPSVCEHVPFHASMIIRGHDKLYINPKLVFRYGD